MAAAAFAPPFPEEPYARDGTTPAMPAALTMPSALAPRAAQPVAGAIPPRPAPSPIYTEKIPLILRTTPRWVCWKWRLIQNEKTGAWKWGKRPTNTAGRVYDPLAPANHYAFPDALAAVGKHDIAGVGFTVTAGDPFVCVDLDGCVAPGEQVQAWAAGLVDTFSSYTEISPSGSGLHIWLFGQKPGDGCRKGGDKVEIYSEKRFLCMTGNHLAGTPTALEERQEALDAVYEEYIAQPAPEAPTALPVAPTATTPPAALDISDDDLLRKMFRSENGDAKKALWNNTDGGNPSSGDQALCNHLAWWTNKDEMRMDAMFRESSRMRPKWDEKRGELTYGQKTIAEAIKDCVGGYESKAKRTKRSKPTADASSTSGFALTDLGNAERFAAQHADKILFDVAAGRWRSWDGKRWALDGAGAAMRLAAKTARSILGEAQHSDSTEHREALAKWAIKSESRDRLKAMVDLAQSRPTLATDAAVFDADRWLLNVNTGTLDLRTGGLHPHERRDRLTRLAPVEYCADAQHEVLDRFLSESLPDASLRAYVQRAVGYSLTGDTREEVLFFIYGPERSGKSTFCEAFKRMLGDYAATADSETFLKRTGDGGVRTDVARLAGTRLVLTSELDDGKAFAEGLVKRLTGGDTITARHLYEREFEFVPAFKLWMEGNHRPRADAADGAMWRRIRVLPFDRTVPKEREDKSIKAAMIDPRACGPALLSWALAGCLAWQRDGLGTVGAVDSATTAYRVSQDTLADFFAERCVFGPCLMVSAAVLSSAYAEYCRENGIKHPVGPRKIVEWLRDHGASPTRFPSGQRAYVGVGMQAPDTSDTSDSTSGKSSHEENIGESFGNGVGPVGPVGEPETDPYDAEQLDALEAAEERAAIIAANLSE